MDDIVKKPLKATIGSGFLDYNNYIAVGNSVIPINPSNHKCKKSKIEAVRKFADMCGVEILILSIANEEK